MFLFLPAACNTVIGWVKFRSKINGVLVLKIILYQPRPNHLDHPDLQDLPNPPWLKPIQIKCPFKNVNKEAVNEHENVSAPRIGGRGGGSEG